MTPAECREIEEAARRIHNRAELLTIEALGAQLSGNQFLLTVQYTNDMLDRIEDDVRRMRVIVPKT